MEGLVIVRGYTLLKRWENFTEIQMRNKIDLHTCGAQRSNLRFGNYTLKTKPTTPKQTKQTKHIK